MKAYWQFLAAVSAQRAYHDAPDEAGDPIALYEAEFHAVRALVETPAAKLEHVSMKAEALQVLLTTDGWAEEWRALAASISDDLRRLTTSTEPAAAVVADAVAH